MADAKPPLLKPAKARDRAPEQYQVRLQTTKGDVVIEVVRAWAPLGADRFYNLVRIGFYDDTTFFRAIDGFMVQFGLNGTPAVNDAWGKAMLADDPVTQSNVPGTITFAAAGRGTRTTQVFVNYVDNARLDTMGFAPFGRVVSGMDALGSLYKAYGEGGPRGNGPAQEDIRAKGDPWLKTEFPRLDRIVRAEVLR